MKDLSVRFDNISIHGAGTGRKAAAGTFFSLACSSQIGPARSFEKQSSSSARYPCLSKTEAEAHSCKPLSTALEEVHKKGTLMERLEMLENRVFQLSLEINAENTSGSCSSTVLAPEENGDEAASSVVTGKAEHLIFTHQDSQTKVTTQEHESIIPLGEACPRRSNNCQKRKMGHKKWLRWLRMGC
ncbi:hypothetical protein Tsubulata_048274 [Turnera subulata]|uniref:Uncharacterized protein n=1 Tax=Turnera subulata TaxID=218843 RepID=A0A9Q0GGK6_9ROSI|nr:hypothetical protein Tsubulata_048274 [Turnera subulata]